MPCEVNIILSEINKMDQNKVQEQNVSESHSDQGDDYREDIRINGSKVSLFMLYY